METRVFSPSAYTFGEQRPLICHHISHDDMPRAKRRKSESEKNEGANGPHLPRNKKRAGRASLPKSGVTHNNT